jgi:hypothetical protein
MAEKDGRSDERPAACGWVSLLSRRGCLGLKILSLREQELSRG